MEPLPDWLAAVAAAAGRTAFTDEFDGDVNKEQDTQLTEPVFSVMPGMMHAA